MAYDEARNYSGALSAEVRKPAMRDHWNEVRDQLHQTRDILQSALHRLRGPGVPIGDPIRGAEMPDPDHIVFLGQQTMGLASEVQSLARDLADYI